MACREHRTGGGYKKLLNTYRWSNIIDAWRKGGNKTGGDLLALLTGQEVTEGGGASGFLLPYAPSLDRWTDEHYRIFTYVELKLGNRKELSPEEQKDVDFIADIEEDVEQGKENWLEKVENYFDSGYDIDDIPIDEQFVIQVEEEENDS